MTFNHVVRGSSPRRCTSKKDRFSACLFCWCILRGRVRGTAVTLAKGNVKSAVVRIRESEYCRGFPQAGNGKVSRRCKMSRGYNTCLFCRCTLRGRVRGAAVTLAIGNVKSAVVRIRVSEYSRGFTQAGNGKVSRRCKMSRGYNTCLLGLKVKCWGVKKNTSTFILESVVFYVLNYNFEQNLGSLLTLYVIYVIMFKKKLFNRAWRRFFCRMTVCGRKQSM